MSTAPQLINPDKFAHEIILRENYEEILRGLRANRNHLRKIASEAGAVVHFVMCESCICGNHHKCSEPCRCRVKNH